MKSNVVISIGTGAASVFASAWAFYEGNFILGLFFAALAVLIVWISSKNGD
jgi:hypothetical protein